MRRFAQYTVLTTATAFIILFGLISIYGAALRDPRFLDGWLLVGGMVMQLAYHLRKKRPDLAIGKATAWMRVHICTGLVVVVVFFFHTAASLPDSLFEWLIWSAFMLVAVSGGGYRAGNCPSFCRCCNNKKNLRL